MKVLAADGCILCRGVVRTLTLLRDDVSVIVADSIDEVLALISELPDLDLVLLDARMPGMEYFTGLRRTVEKLPEVPVIVTSPNESHTEIAAAIRNGARGYFPLSTKPYVLEHALPLILSGEYYIPACALRFGQGDAILAHERAPSRMRSADRGLTLRQREIIVMLAEGKSNKEIAREFKVLEGTVKLHVKGILRKLGVRNRTEAVLVAARRGYLPKGALGIEGTVTRTAANVEGELCGALTPSPQSGEGNKSPDGANWLRRPEPARGQQTAATKEASSGKVPLGSTDNDQADAIARTKATNIVSLSPKKSKPA